MTSYKTNSGSNLIKRSQSSMIANYPIKYHNCYFKSTEVAVMHNTIHIAELLSGHLLSNNTRLLPLVRLSGHETKSAAVKCSLGAYPCSSSTLWPLPSYTTRNERVYCLHCYVLYYLGIIKCIAFVRNIYIYQKKRL